MNSNSVNDASQAVDKVLGYGVDKEGFFTSDLNEAAGLPKDYRIYSDITKYLDKISNYHLAPFSSFDLAGTLKKAYQAFEQVFIGINAKQSISEEDFLNLPAAFDYSFDNGKFKLHKIYNLDEYQSDVRQRTSGKNSFKEIFFRLLFFLQTILFRQKTLPNLTLQVLLRQIKTTLSTRVSF